MIPRLSGRVTTLGVRTATAASNRDQLQLRAVANRCLIGTVRGRAATANSAPHGIEREHPEGRNTSR